MANQFKKRVDQIFISARNGDKGGGSFATATSPALWDGGTLNSMREFPFIVNTVGVEGLVLFGPDFFRRWQGLHQHCPSAFIDLGHPSVIETEFGS